MEGEIVSRQRVEHRVELIIGGKDELEHILRQFESEGWELCAADSSNRRFIFKRPIAEDATTEWEIERKGIIAALRELCAAFGDNDWPDDLDLRDVIEKHLGKHLHVGPATQVQDQKT
jgi:hypothetical protein